MSKVGDLLNEMGHHKSFEEFMNNNNVYADFTGILTLDLHGDEAKRVELYTAIQKGKRQISFKKADELDTIWLVTCSNFATKEDANQELQDFFEDIVLRIKIQNINVAFNLTLSYLDVKPSTIDRADYIKYSLLDNQRYFVKDYLEPSSPIFVEWNKKLQIFLDKKI